MPEWGQRLAPLSLLSCAADLIRIGTGGVGYFTVALDVGALLLFAAALHMLAHWLHHRAQLKVD
jgi:hypothetical protein